MFLLSLRLRTCKNRDVLLQCFVQIEMGLQTDEI